MWFYGAWFVQKIGVLYLFGWKLNLTYGKFESITLVSTQNVPLMKVEFENQHFFSCSSFFKDE